VISGLGLWIAIGMGWVKFKDDPLMNKCVFLFVETFIVAI
jgi:hypothetical protein